MHSGPLEGKCIVVTRAPEQTRELAAALESMGARVLSLPTVGFLPPEDWRELDNALRRLSGFDAILFASKNAVRYLFQRLSELGIKCEVVGSPGTLIAAVGPATAEAVAANGVRVNYVAEESTGEGLARELRGFLRGRKVLLPRSDRGDELLPSALRESGADVTEVVAYRTISPEALDPIILGRIRSAEVDSLVFASPSAVQNFAHFLAAGEFARVSQRVQFAAIGPTTARAIRDAGACVEIEATESSAAGLADSIAKYYQRQAASARRS